MVAPLKLNATGGDLKEMTTTEEQFLAYQAGLQLAAMGTADQSALRADATGTNIGSYANTFYNEAVGTHPGSSISIGTTTTSVYQTTSGVASETGLTRPCKFTGAGTRLDEMDDTGFNEVVDRIIGIIAVNEYPGTYRLGSSLPSGDYDIHLASIFTDTRTDGGSVAYNIYQRQSITAPTTVRPIRLDGVDGNVKEMSDAEIKLTFGQRGKTRIISAANFVGAYQLRSSASGAPSDPGTWVARGTATDTRNTTADANYAATYSADYSADYTANYENPRSTDYLNEYIGYYTTNFTATSTNPDGTGYTSFSSGNFPGFSFGQIYWYQATFTGYFAGPAYYAGDYVGDYAGNYAGNFIGDYLGNYLGNYVGNYTGNYEGNYDGLTIGAGTGTIETYTLYMRTA